MPNYPQTKRELNNPPLGGFCVVMGKITFWRLDGSPCLGTEGRETSISRLGYWLRMRLLPPVARILLAEIRRLPRRISDQRELWWDSSDPVVPSDMVNRLVQIPSKHRRAYIEDMTLLQNRYTDLSAFDRQVASRAWLFGVERASCSCCSGSGQPS